MTFPRVPYDPDLLALLQACTRDELRTLPIYAMNADQIDQVHQFIRDLNDAELRQIKKDMTMDITKVQNASSADPARQYAIDWQNWQADQSMTWVEIAEWQAVFIDLAGRFDLHDEFIENGII